MNLKFYTYLLLTVIITSNNLFAQKWLQPEYGLHIQKWRKKVTLPMLLHSNIVIIPVLINNIKDTLNFILDTGVSNVIITNPSLILKNGLQFNRRIIMNGLGFGVEQKAFVSTGNTISIGHIKGRNQSFIVLEKDHLDISKYIGIRIDGLIGYDLFNYFVVQIDYQRKKVLLRESNKFKTKNKKWTTLSIEIKGNKPYLNEVKLENNNQELLARLMVDTGAGHAISLDLGQTDSTFLPIKLLPSTLGKGLNGELTGHIGRLKQIKIDQFILNDVITAFPDSASWGGLGSQKAMNRNGSIGNELLRRFNVIFNYRNGYIQLKPINNKVKENFEHNMSGIEIVAMGSNFNRFLVDKIHENSPGERAGILEGDELININGAFFKNENIDTIFRTLNRKEGKTVKLVLLRNNIYLTKEIILERRI